MYPNRKIKSEQSVNTWRLHFTGVILLEAYAKSPLRVKSHVEAFSCQIRGRAVFLLHTRILL